MIALIGNEFVKLFHKKLTYVILIVILICSVAVPVVEHYASERYDDSSDYTAYLQSEKDYLEEAVDEGTTSYSYYDLAYNKASLDVINLLIEADVESFYDWRENYSYQITDYYTERYLINYYLQKDKTAIAELEENGETYGIDSDALNYYYNHNSLKKLTQRYNELTTLIGNVENAILNDNPTYINQLNVDLAQDTIDATQDTIDDLNKSLKSASSSEKETINEQIEQEELSLDQQNELMVWLQYRVDNAISLNYYDWKNQRVSAIENAISTTYSTPMTKEEFDQTDSDLSYEEYLENFEEEIADANDTIILYQYALDQNIPPADFADSTRSHLQDIYFLITVVTLGIIVIGSSIVSSEYNTGTIRLLLIRPKKRSKILLSKYISVLLIAAVLLALCFGCYLAATIFVYGSEDFAYPILSVANGVVTETPVLQTILPVFAKSAVVILFLFSLTFFFTSVVKSTVLAVALPMVVVAFSGLSFQLMAYLGFYKIASFSFLPYLQLWQVINESGNIGYYMRNEPSLQLSATYGFWLLIGLSIICLAISLLVFTKRDVKN